MKTTKNVFISKNVATLSATQGIGKADPVPTTGAPATPTDFVPSKGARGARVQPPQGVIKAAAGAAKEIADSTTYAADFGSSAPAPATVAANIAFASAWSGQYMTAEAWYLYVKEQTRLAWLQANPQLDELGPVFAYARTHNDAIDTQYASTAKLFDARSEPAVKGAAVKASKKAASKAKKSGASAASAEHATAAATVPNGVEAAAATTTPTPPTSGNGAAAKN
jgi:hypothetical protein